MIFWSIILLMLAAAVLCVLLPLMVARKQNATDIQAIDVYKRQLEELDSNTTKTANAQVELERAEIARRILKEARTSESGPRQHTRTGKPAVFASLLALVLLPAISLATYAKLGSPGMPDAPLAAMKSDKLEDKSIQEMVSIAEKHLEKNPDDAKGWEVLANVYGRLQKPAERANALQQIIRISGPNAERVSDLGEALTVANGNIVTARARDLFSQVLKNAPENRKAAFYTAVALEQEGQLQKAYDSWTALAALDRENPRWQSLVGERLKTVGARLGKSQPGPSPEQVEQAATMTDDDRTAMIQSMVDGLSQRLKEEPDDFSGWARLVRSYTVLQQPKRAAAALASARNQFRNDGKRLAQLDVLEREFKLKSTKTDSESQ